MKNEERKIEKKEIISFLKGYKDLVAVSMVVSQRPQFTDMASLSAGEVEVRLWCVVREPCAELKMGVAGDSWIFDAKKEGKMETNKSTCVAS